MLGLSVGLPLLLALFGGLSFSFPLICFHDYLTNGVKVELCHFFNGCAV